MTCLTGALTGLKRLTRLLSLVVLLLATPLQALATSPATTQTEPRIHVIYSGSDRLVVELFTPAYTRDPVEIDGVVYDQLALNGAYQTSEPGKPALPMLSALVGVPAGARVAISVLEDRMVTIPGRFQIAPVASPQAPVGEFQAGALQIQPDTQLYQQDALYPTQPARVAGDAWLRDQRLLRLEFYPFQYNPSRSRLIWHQYLRLELRFEMDGKPTSQLAVDSPAAVASPFEALLKESLVNYDVARTWRGFPQSVAQGLSSASAPAVLEGPRYRISISQDGIYRLTYASLEAALPPGAVSTLDPTTFQLKSQGQEVVVYVHNSDGAEHLFSPGEYILFYGERFRGDRMAGRYTAEDDHWLTYSTQLPNGAYVPWKPELNGAMLEKYTNTNVYWLTYGGAPGLRMATVNGAPGGAPLATTYRELVRVESDVFWFTRHNYSVETFFWDNIATSSSTTRTYQANLTGVAAGAYSATLRAQVFAFTNNDLLSPDHHSILYLNDPARTNPVQDATWDGKSRFLFEMPVSQSRLQEGNNQLDLRVYKTPAVASENLYLDWFEIEYQRLFQAANDRIAFSTAISGTLNYQVTGFAASDLGLLEVTNALTPTLITGATLASGTLSFQLSHTLANRYFAAAVQDLPAAEIQYYLPPDLTEAADYVLITHRDFLTATQALADYRAAQGLTTLVVDVQDLYNQFTEGILNPLAVKNFLAYTFANWSAPPAFVLLVGDGNWNFKASPRYNALPIYMPPNLSWVDPWWGEVDSANLLANVVGSDLLPDVSIARLTANSPADVDAAVAKIIAYESAPRQDWQRRMLFVADNIPDTAGNFIALSDDIIGDFVRPGYEADRIYLNSYNCLPGGLNSCPQVNAAITQTLSLTGTLFANYIGHAAIDRWTSESVFNLSNVQTLSNGARLPVVLSMSCLDGYWIHPGFSNNPLQVSLMEEMVRAPGKGAVAAFASTGYGVASGHDILQRGFYEAVFDAGIWQLGSLASAAKLEIYASGAHFDLINSFTIFGDPALQVASPYAFSLAPGISNLSGAPGNTITHTLQIENSAAITDTFTLSATGYTWAVTAPLSVTIPGNSSLGIPVRVSIPPGIADGVFDQADLAVQSLGDVSQSGVSVLKTTAYNYGSSMAPALSTLVGSPAQQVTHTLRLTNQGGFSDSFDLSLSSNAWATAIQGPLKVGPLAPGAGVDIAVRVSIPAGAGDYETDIANLWSTSQGDPSRKARAELRTTARHYGVLVAPTSFIQFGEPGKVVLYSLQVTNSGGFEDSYNLSLSGYSWPAAVQGASSIGPLLPGQSAGVLVNVSVPLTAIWGSSDTAILTVSSQNSPAITGVASLTTNLPGNLVYRLFLPTILR